MTTLKRERHSLQRVLQDIESAIPLSLLKGRDQTDNEVIYILKSHSEETHPLYRKVELVIPTSGLWDEEKEEKKRMKMGNLCLGRNNSGCPVVYWLNPCFESGENDEMIQMTYYLFNGDNALLEDLKEGAKVPCIGHGRTFRDEVILNMRLMWVLIQMVISLGTDKVLQEFKSIKKSLCKCDFERLLGCPSQLPQWWLSEMRTLHRLSDMPENPSLDYVMRHMGYRRPNKSSRDSCNWNYFFPNLSESL
jgi:hypothetical protein